MGAPLPYDKKTEDVVLGSVIHNPEDYDSVAKFFTNKDVFYQPRAQLLWQKLTEMKKEGQHIDTLTVCTSLSQEETIQGLDKIYITDCTSETCTAGMTEFYANKVYQKYLLRQVILQSEEIKEKAQGNSKDVYQTIVAKEMNRLLSENYDSTI